MRIAIDGRALEEREATGVARYLRNILREWDRALPDEIEIWCYLRQPNADIARFRRLHWRIVPGGIVGRKGLLWQNAILPRAAREDGGSVLWAPFNLAPLATDLPVVATVHDASFAANPGWFGPRERRLWLELARWSARRAARVLTVSHFSKRELVARLGVAPAKVVVTPLAADPSFHPPGEAEIAALRARLDLWGPYVLYLGALFARRNIVPLLDAFACVARQQPDWQLLLVGPNRHYPPLDVEAAVRERGLEGRVRHIPYAAEADLRPLYGGAEVFIYPSSYEGFGLTVLEAMACGTPVIAGAMSSLPEVAGDAALLVEPSSPRALAAALLLVGTQERLRGALKSRGIAQTARFSWARTAEATLQALVEAASETKRETSA
jgi:glycosyltransferase involved in cell wall biosynthesis